MRATWVVLGALLVGGGAAYWHLRWNGGADGETEDGAANAVRPGLEHTVPKPASPPEPPAPVDPDEVLAVKLLQEMAEAKAAGDTARHVAALQQLQKEAWEAPSARRFAVHSGWTIEREATRLETSARVKALDRA